ncbi:MAG: hypothetical protein P4M15_04235 [Alphaproteobacteria bacterium]|nr:hypothetical protein [Alphaproteobacteria bacterium]
MTDNCSGKKGGAALFVSVAANIFLVAFTLGRFSTPGFMPPPGFGGHAMMFLPGMHAGPPPFGESGDFMPPPSPLFGPGDLFTPDEVRADELRMREDFAKIEGLRKDFATQLETGPISKDDVLKHFSDIDQVMNTVKKEAQTRAADKISAMSPEDRQKFAQSMLGKENRR